MRNGTLVAPEQVNFPSIPATHYAGWPALPPVQFSPLTMNRNVLLDFSVVPPQPVGPEYTTLVPQVDEDATISRASACLSWRRRWAHTPAGRCCRRGMAHLISVARTGSSYPSPTRRPTASRWRSTAFYRGALSEPQCICEGGQPGCYPASAAPFSASRRQGEDRRGGRGKGRRALEDAVAADPPGGERSIASLTALRSVSQEY